MSLRGRDPPIISKAGTHLSMSQGSDKPPSVSEWFPTIDISEPRPYYIGLRGASLTLAGNKLSDLAARLMSSPSIILEVLQ